MKQTDFPEKLVLEPTTRCNFKCEMCVKQSKGCAIEEGDMAVSLFSRCEGLFPYLKSVIFTGIGEPLLNPHLEKFAARARDLMPEGSIRGFQTNGRLMTRARARDLFEAGINKICISVDTIEPSVFDRVRNGGLLSDVDQAFDALKRAKSRVSGATPRIGVEFVLMKKNRDELSRVVAWAAEKGADFMIVTHLTAYEKAMEDQAVYLNNSFEALSLFDTFQQKALSKGLDLKSYAKVLWKYREADRDIYRLVGDLKDEALRKDLYINLFHLMEEVDGEYDRLKEIFDRALETAKGRGIDLTLPVIRPRTDRRCPFVEDNTLFVSWDGNAAPCYFLWHQYAVMRAGYVKQVTPVNFGNLNKQTPEEIWNRPDFKAFRQKVTAYDYPNCHAWCETRCDYVLDAPFVQDCYINDIPCCDCHWSLGLLNCLS